MPAPRHPSEGFLDHQVDAAVSAFAESDIEREIGFRSFVEEQPQSRSSTWSEVVEETLPLLMIGNRRRVEECDDTKQIVARQRASILELEERELLSAKMPLGIAAARTAVRIAGGRRQIEIGRHAVNDEVCVRPYRQLV